MNKQLPMLVESPSGRTIGPQEFLKHPDRPLAIRERQEMIKLALERANTASGARPLGTSRKGSKESSASGSSRKATPGSSRKGSANGVERKGGEGMMGGKGNASVGHVRNGSNASSRTYLTFEQAKIEEGRVAFEEKEMKRRKGRRGGCFGGCFGKG